MQMDQLALTDLIYSVLTPQNSKTAKDYFWFNP